MARRAGHQPDASKDYYNTLGLQKGASEDEIRKSYRKLAMKWHPVRAPAAPSFPSHPFADLLVPSCVAVLSVLSASRIRALAVLGGFSMSRRGD
jgi:hypothetical protein